MRVSCRYSSLQCHTESGKSVKFEPTFTLKLDWSKTSTSNDSKSDTNNVNKKVGIATNVVTEVSFSNPHEPKVGDLSYVDL